MEILQHLVAVALLGAALYFGLRFLKRRNDAREDGSGGNPPSDGGREL
jgi:hypothetical protein